MSLRVVRSRVCGAVRECRHMQPRFAATTMLEVDKTPFIRSNVAATPLVCEENYANVLLRAIWSHATRAPDRPAIIDAQNREIRVTYAQLYTNSLSVAAFLQNRGFKKGDTFALVLPNCAEFAAAMIGGTLIGGACTGCSSAFKPFELERQFQDSRSRVVFVASKKLAEVREAIANCPLVELIIIVDEEHKKTTATAAAAAQPLGYVHFADVLHTPPILSSPPPPIDAKNDIFSLPYSSGTTGIPKGVMLTHSNVGTMINVFNWYMLEHFYPTLMKNYNPQIEAQVLFMPFYHCYGMSMICASLVQGFTVVALRAFGLELFCQSIQDFKAKQLYGVPPVFLLLAKNPIVDNYDLSSLVHACTGAAPIGVEVCSELKKRLKLRYVGQGWGMSECSMAAMLPNPQRENFSACGYVLPTNEIKVVDTETGETLPKTATGELCVRSPTVMRGYLNRPAATAQTIDRDGWLHTGDVGNFDANGDFYVVDRIKELIKVKGLQVSPAELEDLLLGHPKIADVAVIGVVDKNVAVDIGEELPKAFIVRKDASLSEVEVKDYVKARVAHYKQLSGGVEFLDAIPKVGRKQPCNKLLTGAQLSEPKWQAA